MSTSNLEKDFIRNLLADKTRLDGRSFNELRKLDIEFGKEYGNVQVTLGNTRLIVQVSASVKFPAPERPFEGLFHVTTDISSMASPQFENGRSNGSEEILVSRMIEKAIRRSNAVDLESLCIVAGKRCWMIRADVHYLDYDGGLVDASCVGVIAALLHFRRPDTSVDGDKIIIHDITDRPPVPLSVLHIPISASWSFIPLESTIGSAATESDMETDSGPEDSSNDVAPKMIAILDATAAEQELRKGEVTITANRDQEICQITKAGGAQISTSDLLKFTSDAHEISKRISEIINKKLLEDFESRNKGNSGSNLKSTDVSALNKR